MASPDATAVLTAQVDYQLPEDELLQGLVPTIRLAENEYKFREGRSITTAKELLKGYIQYFKQASSRLAVDKDSDVQILTWDAIIKVTEDALLFQHHPKLLMEIDPDLQFKPPAFKHPGLHTFAHSTYPWPPYKARYMIQELNKLGIEITSLLLEDLWC
ncbi:hypothetical protein L207DRAFT_506938 [Hyaloscypha variabilis F]|uniref:Uncharacterized protein n=1 Tax=Hyaloscypha variabilis (strain UAMH 11265 / GT02V1 / F) TaxID=1149755 RepID=A0A2J6S580_HYAVF|nr:hypothetical protein L207DRAFT_506938 [Hyaloscypha variabilis F]